MAADKIKEYFDVEVKPTGLFDKEEDFRAYISDEKNAREYFETDVKPDGTFKSYDEFSGYLELKKKEPSGQGAGYGQFDTFTTRLTGQDEPIPQPQQKLSQPATPSLGKVDFPLNQQPMEQDLSIGEMQEVYTNPQLAPQKSALKQERDLVIAARTAEIPTSTETHLKIPIPGMEPAKTEEEQYQEFVYNNGPVTREAFADHKQLQKKQSGEQIIEAAKSAETAQNSPERLYGAVFLFGPGTEDEKQFAKDNAVDIVTYLRDLSHANPGKYKRLQETGLDDNQLRYEVLNEISMKRGGEAANDKDILTARYTLAKPRYDELNAVVMDLKAQKEQAVANQDEEALMQIQAQYEEIAPEYEKLVTDLNDLQGQYNVAEEKYKKEVGVTKDLLKSFPEIYKEQMDQKLKEIKWNTIKNISSFAALDQPIKEGFKGFYNGVVDMTANIVQLSLDIPNLGYRIATGEDLEGHLGRGIAWDHFLDKAKVDTMEMEFYDPKTGKVNWYALIPQGMEQLGQAFLVYGKGARILNTVSGLEKGSKFGVYGASFLMSYGNNKDLARRAGIEDPVIQTMFAITASAFEAKAEGIYDDAAMLSVKNQAIMRTIQAMKSGSKEEIFNATVSVFKDVLKNNAEELTQDIGNTVIQSAANAAMGDNLFDATYSMAEAINTIAVSTLVGAVGSGAAQISIGSQKSAALRALSELPDFEGTLMELVESKNITAEQADAVKQQVEQFKKTDALIPAGISDKKRNEAIPYIEYRAQLEEEAKTLAKPFADELKEKISVIDEEILRITTGKKPEQVGEKSEKQVAEDKRRKDILEEVKAVVSPPVPEVVEEEAKPAAEKSAEQLAKQKKSESFGYSGVEQAVNSVNRHTGKQYTFKEFDTIPDQEFSRASGKSATVKKNKAFQEQRFRQRSSAAQQKNFEGVVSKLKKSFPKIDVVFEKPANGALGSVQEGKIYLDPDNFRSDTPIHEYAHVWIDLSRQKYVEFYKNITGSMEGTSYFEEAQRAYPDLPRQKQLEEAAAQAIADKGVAITEKSKLAKFKDFMVKIGKRIAEWMGIDKPVNFLEHTWDDLSGLAAQDLLAKRPISYVTSEQIAKVDETAYPIAIENGVMDLKKRGIDAAVNFLSKKRHSGIIPFLKDEFISGGKSPQIKHLDDQRKRNLEGFSRQMAGTVSDWRNALKEYSAGLSGSKAENEVKLNEVMDSVNEYLVKLNDRQALSEIPEGLRPVVQKMRDEVDGLSTLLLESGFIDPDSELYASISQNLGVYMNRSYAAFVDPSWNKRMFPQGVRGKGGRADGMEVRYQKAFDYIKSRFENFVTLGDELYTFKLNPYGEIIEVLDSKGDEVTDAGIIGQAAAAASQKDSVTDDEVAQVLKEIARENKDLKGPGGGKIAKLALGFFNKRKDIPSEIRLFLGEYENPESRYLNSVDKMASYLENKKMLVQLRNLGIGKIFFDKPTGDFDKKIAATDEYSPLSDLYTSEEIYKTFLKEKPDRSTWMKIVAVSNFGVKSGKTVFSPASQIRNFGSNFVITFANGYWTPFNMANTESKPGYATAFVMASEDLKNKGSAALKELAELGVINNSALGRDVQDALERVFDGRKDSPVAKDPGKAMKVLESIFGPQEISDALKTGGSVATRLYMFGDNVHKIFNWYSELSQVQYMNPEMSEQAQKRKAQQRFLATNVNYDKTPKIVERIRKTPVFGAFPSFPAEIIRISYNIPAMAISDINEGVRTGNMRQALVGINRGACFFLATAGSYAIPALLSRAIGGADDDDERLLEIQAPGFAKNTQRIILSVEGTKIRFMDFSWQNPFNIHGKAVTAFQNARKDQKELLEAFAEATMQYLDPFIEEDIMTSTLLEIIDNLDPNGREIYNKEDDFWNKSEDILNYIWSKLQPGITAQSEKLYKAITDRKEGGREYDLAAELTTIFTGTRIYEIDAADRLKSLSYKFNKYFEQDEKIFLNEFYKNTNDPEQPKRVEEAYKRANDIYRKRQEEIIEYVSLLRKKGVSDKRMKELLEPIRVNGLQKSIKKGEVKDLDRPKKKKP